MESVLVECCDLSSTYTTTDQLHMLFEEQKGAYRNNINISYEERIEALKTLESMVKKHSKDMAAALAEDYITHPPQLTSLAELLGIIVRSQYCRSNLKRWMKPERKPIDRMVFGLSKCYVAYQPVGVVGIIGPWNIPFLATLGPLAFVLAAGNRAIIKVSEMTPACGELLKTMVSGSFEPSYVTVVTGEQDLGEEFAGMPWDHLLYTGNPAVGRLVMKAASENLTPVTLELGGKCPVIVGEDSVTEKSVTSILGVKIIKNGQTCISADYVFVPEDRRDDFVSLCRKIMPRLLPSSYTNSPQCSGIINDRHMNRLLSYLEDAERKGATLVQCYPAKEAAKPRERKIPFSLVLDPTEDMAVMREEIFGPILPVKTYRTLDEAISYVNSHEKPLALYCFTGKKEVSERVLRETASGGACVNAVGTHVLHPSLPFGGIGNSGIGRYGGVEGFKNFSNQKAVHRQGWSLIPPETFYTPYGKKLDWLLGLVLR